MKRSFDIADAPWIGDPDYYNRDHDDGYDDEREDYEYEWRREEERMEEN